MLSTVRLICMQSPEAEDTPRSPDAQLASEETWSTTWTLGTTYSTKWSNLHVRLSQPLINTVDWPSSPSDPPPLTPLLPPPPLPLPWTTPSPPPTPLWLATIFLSFLPLVLCCVVLMWATVTARLQSCEKHFVLMPVWLKAIQSVCTLEMSFVCFVTEKGVHWDYPWNHHLPNPFVTDDPKRRERINTVFVESCPVSTVSLHVRSTQKEQKHIHKVVAELVV